MQQAARKRKTVEDPQPLPKDNITTRRFSPSSTLTTNTETPARPSQRSVPLRLRRRKMAVVAPIRDAELPESPKSVMTASTRLSSALCRNTNKKMLLGNSSKTVGEKINSSLDLFDSCL
eukprot:Gregarina_sp_Poly_1__10943@NODE_85_length_15275_cov_135_187336_g73_i0_p10_GENE_NODE_85_length_15275_cov_135_187336_g73_i0NODE_85_length_15275_cov_135_187336_g73_i0_p10_ORF_typecomplete_len119_score15_76_NODE_85_length_15275_cov_135_187336_g73_i047425098